MVQHSGEPSRFAAEFGRYLRYLREEVYGEAIRPFAKRIGLSPGYLGRLELGNTGVPRRSTVEEIAERLDCGVDVLLVKAGYTPANTPEEAEFAYVVLKLRRLRQEDLEIVVELVDLLAAKRPRDGNGTTSKVTGVC